MSGAAARDDQQDRHSGDTHDIELIGLLHYEGLTKRRMILEA